MESGRDDRRPKADSATESALRESLPDVAGGLASVYGLLAVGHAYCMPAAVAPAAVAFAGASSALSFGLWLRWRSCPPTSHVSSWVAAIGALGFANAVLTLALSPVPRETTGIAVFVLGSGLLFLSRARLLAMIAVGFVAWAAAACRTPADPGWPQAGFVLALVSALSLLMQSIRTRYERVCIELLEGQARLRDSIADLSESERRFRIIAEYLADGILTIDEHARIQFANGAVSRMLGYPVEDLLGRELSCIVPEGMRERVRGILRLCADMGAQSIGAEGVTLTALHADGSEVAVEISLAETRLDGRRMLLGAVRDIRARKRAENARLELERRSLQTQKLESLGLLAGGIAHDFNNLLAVILGRANAALEDPAEEKAVREDLAEIRGAAERARSLTRQLLTCAGRGPSSPLPISLSRHVAMISDLFRSSISKRIRIAFDLPSELPPIEVDPGQLRQVVTTLVMNAADSIGDEEGWIHVATRVCILTESESAQLLPALERNPGRYVCLEVSDDGCEIDLDDLTRVFDPFYSRRGAGGDLDLASLLGIVRQQGGGMRVQNRPDGGTCFEVFFPASAGPLDTASSLRGESPGGGGRILVIENEPGVRQALRRTLERLGFEVEEASEGRAGIARVAADRDAFSAVVLDLSMPGLGGEETFAGLRSIAPQLPVVLCSGHDGTDTSKRLLDEVAVTFLQKPFSSAQLASCLHSVRRSQSPAPGP